jgi:hypothetical protein
MGELYELDPQDMKYKLNYIKIRLSNLNDSNFAMYSDSATRHPNVAGSNRICIGADNDDKINNTILKGNISKEQVANLFLYIEDCLKIINFGSSYTQLGKDAVSRLHLIQQSAAPKLNTSTTTTLRRI